MRDKSMNRRTLYRRANGNAPSAHGDSSCGRGATRHAGTPLAGAVSRRALLTVVAPREGRQPMTPFTIG